MPFLHDKSPAGFLLESGGAVFIRNILRAEGNSALLRDLAAHEDTHDGGHHQAPGPAGAVAQAVKALEAGVEVRVHLHPVGVELQLRGIQQRLIGGKARHHIIHSLNEVDDVGHGPVGHGGGNVAGHGVRQSGADVIPCTTVDAR